MSFARSRTARLSSRIVLAFAIAWLLCSATQVAILGPRFVAMCASMDVDAGGYFAFATSPWLAAALVALALTAALKERWLHNQVAALCMNLGLLILAMVIDAAITVALYSPMLLSSR